MRIVKKNKNRISKNVNPTSRRATISEGGLEESIKKTKNVNPTSRRATFSEGGVEESRKKRKKHKSDLPEGNV